MNNKGFAITGILYTIFILFMLLISAALANISFKRSTLSKSLAEFENDFALSKIDLLENGYKIEDGSYYASFDGKYIFELTYKLENDLNYKTILCSTYLNKNEEIPLVNNPTLGEDNPAKDFTLIPRDCNKYYYEIIFEGASAEQKMLLKEIYKFKDSD